MIIEVMSREKVLEYSWLQHDEEVAVISISNCGEGFPNLLNNPNNGISSQCRVSFNDVERGMINCITDDDADKIAAFVKETAVKKDKLIVQCGKPLAYKVNSLSAPWFGRKKHLARGTRARGGRRLSLLA